MTIYSIINEGGNVVIGDKEATRIDLRVVDRKEIVRKLDRSLAIVNAHFRRFAGVPLWEKELFRSKKFLSGSSLHFFNKLIPTDEFISVKPTVGDIDTQIDQNLKDQVENWLNSLGNAKLGYINYIGYKKSVGQFITLWNVEGTDLNVQIDLEMVEYEGGVPTAWSSFSHSSSWDDIKSSVKGVFHKYLLRALSTRSLREVTILKGKKETPTKVMTTDLAFSVTAGLRQKLAPTETPGVYKEVATKDSTYITNLDIIFNTFFDKMPTKTDLKKFESFVGILDLINKYFNRSDKEKVAYGFAYTLWGKGAQKLVRGNPKEDFDTKSPAYNMLIKKLGVKSSPEVDQWIKEFYSNYK